MNSATVGDWLDLHGLSVDQCRRLLETEIPAPGSPVDPELKMPPEALWSLVTDCLQAQMTGNKDAVAQASAVTRVRWLTRAAGPRGFTLHGDNIGGPVVCARMNGTLSDVLTLAHEFGHACQIVACGPVFMPPALREVCAFQAEILVATEVGRRGLADAGQLLDLFRARGHVAQEKARRTVLAQLQAPAEPYAYVWNYPLARRAVARMTARPDDLWALFQGKRSLAEVAAL